MHSAHAVIYCHLRPVWPYRIFPHNLMNGTIFGKTRLLKTVFWFSLQLLSETFLLLRRTERDIIINVHRFSWKAPVKFLSDFNETWIFSTDFQGILQYQISFKTCPVGADLFHADVETDITKVRVAHRILQTRLTSECPGLRPAIQYIMHVETR
jgi:hypothetical protein